MSRVIRPEVTADHAAILVAIGLAIPWLVVR